MTAREYLLQSLLVDLIGPGSEGKDSPEEIEREWISESPLSRYFMGILYAQKLTPENISLQDQDVGEVIQDTKPDEISVELKGEFRQESAEDFDDDNLVKDIYSFSPSACGLSFVVSEETKTIACSIKAARYEKINSEEVHLKLNNNEKSVIIKYCEDFGLSINGDKITITGESKSNVKVDDADSDIFWPVFMKLLNFRKQGYKRNPINHSIRVNLGELLNECDFVIPNSMLRIKVKTRSYERGGKLVTVSLFNKAENQDNKRHEVEKCYFQCELEVSIEDKNERFFDLKQLQIGDLNDPSIAMLYHNKKVFAVGHGCSVNWEGNPPIKIKTSFAPIHEIPKVDYFHPRLKELNLGIFNQKRIAFCENDDRIAIIQELQRFVNNYNEWLNEGKLNVDNLYELTAESNYAICMKIVSRMNEGIKILTNNQNAWDAFRDANRAMIMQRYHSDELKPGEENTFQIFDRNTENINYNNHITQGYEWRPFQLGFLLLSIRSIVDPASAERSIADLIWFPTGGGKTEAYLGLIAFTIFFRRRNQHERSFGTAVLMRYTLRLLTSDQFKRASALILACEVIRKSMSEIYGNEEISIGFWVGGDVSPNKRNGARDYVNKLIAAGNGFDQMIKDYPFQIMDCPWCGSSLINRTNLNKSGFFMGHGESFGMHCINPKCAFRDRLPIQIVDEELYNSPPSLLFATVDKFAQIPWQENSRAFFGYNQDSARQIQSINNPPDLIIQDELHLISGPLGSIFGHYETVIDFLCQHNNTIPKIVCSTATVTRADEQIKAIFNRDVEVFPPSAFTAEDSYFAIEKSLTESSGRLYLGLSSIGKTRSSTYIKILSTLLYHKFLLDNEEFRRLNRIDLDSSSIYSTVVSYFNALRDLAQAAGFISDDVREKLQIIRNVKRLGKRHRIFAEELTSRLTGVELPGILRRLKTDNCEISILLTTNMFSVGVDIPRLNIFLMNGQPKSTSEYIQATSRVGRRDSGIVITLYDNFKPRDKSFYENFQAFHQGFYRFVEPNGVTPFSRPVRNRALHALAIGVFRLLIISGDKASEFDAKLLDRELWKNFKSFLQQRCREIDDSQLNLIDSELNKFLLEWEIMKAKYEDNFLYKNLLNDGRLDPNKNPLMIPAGSVNTNWPLAKKVLQSMRNVDVNAKLKFEG